MSPCLTHFIPHLLTHYPIPTFPLLDLPYSVRIVKVTRTFDPTGPAMIIDCSRNPALFLIRSRMRMSRSRYHMDSFFRILHNQIGRRRFEASWDAYQCPPFWITSLQRAAGQKSWTSRALPAARHFFPLVSFSFSFSLSLHPLSCHLRYSFFFSYSVSHSRTRRLTYLAADQTGVHVKFFANVAAPAFNLISDEIKVHFTKLTVLYCHKIYFILLLCTLKNFTFY